MVHVCTPPHWHGVIAAMAARRGKSVWCEKPLTRTIGEGIALSRVVQQTGVPFRVNTWFRLNRTNYYGVGPAREIRRVGVRHFVQTPNHGFPIDWRTLVPGFHFLPATLQAWCFQRFPVGRYARVDDWQAALELATRIRNIRKEDLPVFFPDSKVVCERFLGLTKSFMIHQGFEVDSARAEQTA